MIDVPSGEIVAAGLSMPHSPRWYDGRLWVLESGTRHALRSATRRPGDVEMVAELPGFTRGLDFAAPLAFVGLSQIRETATFGGLPISALEQLECGVCAVDTTTGSVLASLRFDDVVQEIFDLDFLPGVRCPDIAEEGSPVAESSWYLPGRPR